MKHYAYQSDEILKQHCLDCITYYGKDDISMEEFCAFLYITRYVPTPNTPPYGSSLSHYVDVANPRIMC